MNPSMKTTSRRISRIRSLSVLALTLALCGLFSASRAYALGTVTVLTTTATEGTPVSGQIASFTDTEVNPCSAYTAMINYGDNRKPTPATIRGQDSGKGCNVFRTHNYYDEGGFTTTVTIKLGDQGHGVGTNSAAVAEGDSFTASPANTSVSTVENQPFAGTATFTDSNSVQASTDFTGSCSYSGGGTLSGTVSNSGTTYTVTCPNMPSDDEGMSTIQISIAEDGSGTAMASATETVTTTEGDAFTPQSPQTTSIVEGGSVTGSATFTDSDISTPSTDLDGICNYGDGTPNDVGTVSGGSGSFTVACPAHTYTDEQSGANLAITLSDGAPGAASATASNVVTVTDLDSLTATPPSTTVNITRGTTIIGVGTFTNTNSNTDSSDFQGACTLSGVGGTGNATVTNSGTTYTVTCQPWQFKKDGTFTGHIKLTDDPPGTANATFLETVVVTG